MLSSGSRRIWARRLLQSRRNIIFTSKVSFVLWDAQTQQPSDIS
jgi:hypothetical protein